MPKRLTFDQVLTLTGLQAGTIHRWIRMEELEAHGDGLYRNRLYLESDVLATIERMRERKREGGRRAARARRIADDVEPNDWTRSTGDYAVSAEAAGDVQRARQLMQAVAADIDRRLIALPAHYAAAISDTRRLLDRLDVAARVT